MMNLDILNKIFEQSQIPVPGTLNRYFFEIQKNGIWRHSNNTRNIAMKHVYYKKKTANPIALIACNPKTNPYEIFLNCISIMRGITPNQTIHCKITVNWAPLKYHFIIAAFLTNRQDETMLRMINQNNLNDQLDDSLTFGRSMEFGLIKHDGQILWDNNI